MSRTKSRWQVVRPPLAARFHLPTKEDLFHVSSGDSVKLMFHAGDDSIERMWVQVEQCGDSDEWTGRLDSDPLQDYTASVLKHDDLIRFHPYDVIAIYQDGESTAQSDIQQIIDEKLDEVTNKAYARWYRNPSIIIPALVGIAGVAATIIAALL